METIGDPAISSRSYVMFAVKQISIMIATLLFLSCLGLSTGTPIVGGNPADPPNMITSGPSVTFVTPSPVEPPLTAVVSSLTNITVIGLQLPGILAFLGIRYAKPPVSNRRFQRPSRLKLNEDIEATEYGSPCPQIANNEVVGNEDCLFLNIYTPEEGLEKGGLPVLFWIHGGHYKSGSASQYNPERLVKKGLIVVTPQYRLGSLGFLSVGRQELPGNAGLFDVGAALMWTKENIKHFGGNPKKIIPAGQGSGASIATFLAVNPITSPIVQGLIALSGTALSPFSVDKAETNSAAQVASADGCNFNKGLEFIRCMQKLPLNQIIKGDYSLQDQKKDVVESIASMNVPGPAEESIKDDRFLPSFHPIPVLDAIKQGLFPEGIPILTGVTNKETCTAVKGNLFNGFQKKLRSQSFLEKGILKDLLKSNTGLYKNKTVDPSLLNLFNSDSYLKFFGTLTQPLTESIDKVVKLTTDALFNLPVFVMSHLWHKKGKVYLFSLDEAPKKSFSSQFLPNLILSDPFAEKKGASHGDDLGYLFKPQDIYGNPIKGTDPDPEDMSVSDLYVNMVYEFARAGMPMLKPGVPWMPFSPEKNNYMSITKNPKEKQNFNKCEMGLWTGNADILKSVECSVVGEAAQAVVDLLGGAGTGLLNTVKDTTDGLKSGLNDVTKPLETSLTNVTTGLNNATQPLTGLLGLGGTKPKSTTKKPTSQRRPPDLLGLGGIIG